MRAGIGYDFMTLHDVSLGFFALFIDMGAWKTSIFYLFQGVAGVRIYPHKVASILPGKWSLVGDPEQGQIFVEA